MNIFTVYSLKMNNNIALIAIALIFLTVLHLFQPSRHPYNRIDRFVVAQFGIC